MKENNMTNSLSESITRGDLFAKSCPSHEILRNLTGRWAVLILICLKTGNHRYSELSHKLNGISEKMLSQTLKTLEQDGFVTRIDYKTTPPHVEYIHTPLGAEAAVHLVNLTDWIERNLFHILTNKNAKSE